MVFKKENIDSIALSGLQNDKRRASSWSRKAAAFSLVFSLSSLALFAACGDDSSSSSGDEYVEDGAADFFFTEEELAEMGIPMFDSADKLGGCDSINEFETVYVKADSGFYMCYKGKWENDFSDEMFEIEIDTLQSVTELGECSAENEGEMHAVPHDSVATIYDTYACEDGEWVSDFGGSDGVVDPSTVVKGMFKDKRDGTTYKTVKIGNQTWMAENLRYKTKPYFCYGNKAKNCREYGIMYRFDVVENACPSGWRLPTLPEWNTLESSIGTGFIRYVNQKEDPYGLNFQFGGVGESGDFYVLGKDAAYWAKNPTRDFWMVTRTLSGQISSDLYHLSYIRCIKE